MWISVCRRKVAHERGEKILIGVGVFFAFAVIAVAAGIINGKSQGLNMDDMIVDAPQASETPFASPKKDSDEKEISDEEAMDIAMEQLKEKVANAEPNTSDMVDKIALQARDDAKAINDDLANEAIAYIHDTYPNYFTDNETMEQTMYYGYLLDYAYDDNDLRSNLGTDTYQVVKYVYRGVEAVEDTPTQENLRQIEQSLNELQENSASGTANPSSTEELKVWICAEGNKYHKSQDCSQMNEPWQVTQSEAESLGKDRCGRCY